MAETPSISAVLLAAGASTRFGPENKLLADIGGESLIARSASRLLASDAGEIIIVVGPGAASEGIAAALRELPVGLVENPDAERGIGSSIAAGAAAASATATGIMIVPGDMPSLDVALLKTLIDTFCRNNGSKIVHPVTAAGQQRNPVIWPSRFRPELTTLDKAAGGKQLLAAHRAETVTVPADDEHAFEDIDTQDDLAHARARLSAGGAT